MEVGKACDITGKVFGHLIVIKRVPKPSHIKGKPAYWECLCDCGDKVIIMSSALKHAKTISCGCNKRNNLLKKRFGKLLVLGSDKYNNGRYWKCICDCGNTVVVSGGHLSSGHTKSCGCLSRSYNNISGNRYGKILVLDRNYTISGRRIMYNCMCDCGKEKVIGASQLISGNTKSCGCIQNKFYKRNSYKEIIAGRFMSVYKASARRRNIIFDLTREQILKKIFEKCYYCNSLPDKFIKFSRSNNKIPIAHLGLDRINNSIGYIDNNVVPCCSICNMMKFTSNEFDFYKHIKKIQKVLLKKEIWKTL